MKMDTTLKPPAPKSVDKKYLLFAQTILKGLGQIMLQENSITGFLFLIGIFWGSVNMGFAAILATTCGTLTAQLLKYDKTEIEKGLYGFSAALVGVALTLFFKPEFITWLFIIIGSALATIIQHFFIKRKIPAFTFPFVLVTWFFVFCIQYFYPELMAETGISSSSVSDNFTFAIKGFGQVIFQDKLLSGTLFFIAVLISSPIAALYGIAAGILSAIIAMQFSVPAESIGIGLFSYNAVLCAIVFAGEKLKDSIWVLIAVLFSTVISLFMFHYGLSRLTFPFVAASCITLVIRKTIILQLK